MILFSLASLQIVIWQGLVANPLSTGAPVGHSLEAARPIAGYAHSRTTAVKRVYR